MDVPPAGKLTYQADGEVNKRTVSPQQRLRAKIVWGIFPNRSGLAGMNWGVIPNACCEDRTRIGKDDECFDRLGFLLTILLA